MTLLSVRAALSSCSDSQGPPSREKLWRTCLPATHHTGKAAQTFCAYAASAACLLPNLKPPTSGSLCRAFLPRRDSAFSLHLVVLLGLSLHNYVFCMWFILGTVGIHPKVSAEALYIGWPSPGQPTFAPKRCGWPVFSC